MVLYTSWEPIQNQNDHILAFVPNRAARARLVADVMASNLR
ncbi:hypothetical protein BH23GEM7_BH23GEM7_34370 [soil metagenome]